MKKNVFLLLSILVVLLIPNTVFAADPYQFGFQVVKCDPNADGMTAAKCRNNYLNGSLDSYKVSNGGNLEPGTTIMVVVNLKVGTPKTAISLQTFFNYDEDTFTPLMNTAGDNILSSNNKSNFPKFYDEDNDEYLSGWTIESNLTGSTVRLVFYDSTYYVPLDTDLDVAYFFFKVNDDATPGRSTGFIFDTDNTYIVDNAVPIPNNLAVTTTDGVYSVYGAESRDASLKTLTVTNKDTIYPLDPSFTADNTTYYTAVPNGVTSIDLAATVNDSTASIASAGLGTKDLQVGDNIFDIIVTSQYGNTETYQIHVYRLSNDATLSSLILTNGVSIGELQDGVYTYNGSIPYSISNTNVSATPNHANAFIESGVDNWELTNSGTTLNTKSIIVKAENCLDQYSTVPGNVCSSQTYTIEITREAASNNNYLSSLKIDGSLVPDFSKEKTEYTLPNVVTTKTNIEIEAVVEDTGKAVIQSGTGTVQLNIGDNSFNVVVKAEDGSTKTYTIKVRRLSNNINLSDLTVTSNPKGILTPEFTSSFYGTYTYTYDPTVTEVTITAVAEDIGKAYVSLADISTNSEATGTPILNTTSATYPVTTTKVAVTVTAEDGSIQTYPINLTRLKSSNNYLSSLSLSEGTLSPKFNSTTRTYTASVDGSVENVEVYATPAVGYAKVTNITGNTNLQFGVNTIEVEVTAEDGTPASYVINLTREKYTIATLSDLKVDGETITEFASDKFEYTLDNVAFEKDSLEIDAIKTNEYATVTTKVNGNTVTGNTVDLSTGDNEIIVTVTAQDGVTVNDYVINIYREKNDDNTVHGLTVAGLVPTLNSDGDYEVTLPNNKNILNPSDVIVSKSDDATLVKGESISLSTESINKWQFTITSENKTPKTYTILITREPSEDVSISKVTLTIGNDSSRYCLMEGDSCTIAVPVETTEFSLSASINEKATISPLNGTSYTMLANESTKKVILTVTAEDGITTKDYNVIVERQKSSNTNLKSLTYNGISVTDFNAGTLIYNEIVAGTVDKVTIAAEVEDTGKATITTDLSQDFELVFGVNTITVEVKAENGDTKKYTIIITRKNRVDATLSNLTVNGTQVPGFDPEITSYVLSDVDYNTHQLNIVATPNDTLANKSGDGLIDLKTSENVINILVTAHDPNSTKTYTITVNRKLNDNTNIDGITLAGNSATYNSLTGKYEVTVSNSVSEVNTENLVVDVSDPIVSTDKKATYSFDNKNLVTTDTNEIVITVTAEDGTTTQNYVLVVTREKSNIATLKSLTVTNGSFNPSFNSELGEYTVSVPVNTTEFDIAAETTEEHAHITSGVGHYTMNESNMTKEIVVVSEDESVTKKYILNIVREKSSINTLSDITVSEGTLSPEFDKDITSYTVNVDGSVTSIDIGATLTDNLATLSGTGTYDLEVGENKITITVQSESGAKQNYVINVVRAEKSDNYLIDLTVDGETIPEFDKNKNEYTLDEVPNDKTNIVIGAVLSDSDASVSGTGTKGLATGLNTFNLTVTAQNGEINIYTININRAKSNNAKLSLLSINGYLLSPEFDSDITFYEVTVKEDKETLSPNEVRAISDDSNATVEKQDTITLSTTVENYYQVVVTAEDKKETETYTIKINRPKSSDTTLQSVNVTGATISPAFDPNKTEYTLTVPYGSTDFSIEGIPTNNKTIVDGNGNYTIADTIITLNTKAEDNTPGTYTFTVVQALSNDATLSDLSVAGYPLDKTFQPTKLSYTIGNIPYGVNQLIVNAIANNLNAKIEYYLDGVKQDSNIINIPEILGEKTITVKVIPADESTPKSYNISYNLVASSNAYLSVLEPSISQIDFIKTKNYYEITVDNDITSINFDIETEDKNASITINGNSYFTPKTITISDLKVGNNTVSILVTAQDDTPMTYTVVVKRLEATASNNAYLSDLSVDNYILDKSFDMEIEEYSIGEIPYSLTELTIHTTTQVGTSKVSYLVNGNKQDSNVVNIPKENGNGAITIKVTAEDGTTVKNYKITYTKTASNNAYLSNILINNGELQPTTFNKTNFSYTVNVDRKVTSLDITATTEDQNATMQMNGVTYSSPHTLTLSPLASGNTEITILVTAEDGTISTYRVIVVKEADPSSTITSMVYGHTITNGYIKTVGLNITGIDIKNQLDNENEYLEIWTADESRKIEESEKLATGMIVKLMIDGVEHDRKIIVIKGDTNGDGIIDLFDAVKILNHYLERTLLTEAYLEAAYANEDSNIDLFDAVKILNHYLERDFLH